MTEIDIGSASKNRIRDDEGELTNNDERGDVICDSSKQHGPRKSPSGVLELLCQMHAIVGTSQVWQRSVQTDKASQSGGTPAIGFKLREDG